MSDTTFIIAWRGKEVGKLTNSRFDMYYLEGTWVSNNYNESDIFENLIQTFDVKAVDKDPTKGTRVILSSINTNTGNEIHAVVYGLENEILSLRTVYTNEGISWLLKNIR
jgi:hypothetical protein